MSIRTVLLSTCLIVTAACQGASSETAQDVQAQQQTQAQAQTQTQTKSQTKARAVEIADTQPVKIKTASIKEAVADDVMIAPKAQKAKAPKPVRVKPVITPPPAASAAPIQTASVQTVSVQHAQIQRAQIQRPTVQPPAVQRPSVQHPTAQPSTIQIVQAPTVEAAAPKMPTTKAPTPEAAAPNPNAPFNAFLAKYVTPQNGINLVRYADVSPADKASLAAYIERLSRSGPPSSSDEAVMAYWFNLYNAKTVDLILDNYPLQSIREISGPWKKKRLTVAGTPMSLNDIEHKTVRAQFKEPRVHYAFNCASIGCPNLKMTAWEAKTLDSDLTQAARDFIGHPRGVRIDEKGRVDASKIFKWYKEDFGRSEQSLLYHFEKYAAGSTLKAIKANTKIDDFDYDWSLNLAK